MIDICCIGHITRDKIITPQQIVLMSGGTSFYVAHAIQHLPKEVSFQLVTKVGEQDMPVVQNIQKKGINVKVYPSKHTVFFENKYYRSLNNRTQRVLAKADAFTIDEMKLIKAKIYHIGSLLNDDFSPEIIKYLSTKGSISIDAQGFLREVKGEDVHAIDWKDKQEILSCTDIIKINEHEMKVITGYSSPYDAARKLHAWGVKEVIVTLGSEGSIIYANNRFYDIPAYAPREVVDATGCGDTYSAGFLYCRSQGIGFEEAGKFAAAMCTLKLEHSGPFDRSIEEVRRIVKGE